MVNHKQLLEDIQSRKYSQDEIAKRNNCSRSTVVRVIRTNHLGIGQGRRIFNVWRFSETSESLCYLMGIYITDGWIARNYNTRQVNQFSISSTTPEIIEHSKGCILAIGIQWRERKILPSGIHKGKKTQHAITTYSADFASWLYTICEDKSKIPGPVFNAPTPDKLAFLAGIIDGDGHVAKDGSIRIRGTDNWLSELPRLLETLNIRTSGFNRVSILPTGKSYYGVSINRADFRALGGWCIVPSKMDRILNAKETRTERRPKRYKYPCVTCGEMKAARENHQCRNCYMASEKFHQHLIDIAPKGGKSGNAKRWGHS